MGKESIFSFWFRYARGGGWSFHIGWFWIVVVVGIAWWVL
jgi:hypothetical protein